MRKILSISVIAISMFLWASAHPANAAPSGITALTLSPGTVSLTSGQSTVFTLTATLGDGTTVNVTEDATWTPNGGGFTGIPGQRGTYSAIAKGSWSLTASVGGLSASAAITITPGAPTSLNVLPTSAQLTADGLLPMEFYGVDANGNGFDISKVASFSTTDPSGSVSPSGYTPGRAGTWQITTTLGALTDTTEVTITPGMLKTLIVTPSEITIDQGDNSAISVRGLDAKGNDTNPSVKWRTTNNTVASIDTNGTVKAKSAGQTNVIAEADGNVIAVLPVIVAGEASPVETDEVIAVTKPVVRTPQVAAEEIERVPDATNSSFDDNAVSTVANETQCKNIAHPWTVILLIAHLILLSIFFSLLHRGHRYPWWWIPPIALAAAMLGVYAGAFCNDTYLWWPWSIIGITVIFLSVYYQRLDEPDSPPPNQAPPA